MSAHTKKTLGNTYHFAYTRVKGGIVIQDTLHAGGLKDVVEILLTLMPEFTPETGDGEILYVIKVSA